MSVLSEIPSFSSDAQCGWRMILTRKYPGDLRNGERVLYDHLENI
jgi:hypothetical protein